MTESNHRKAHQLVENALHALAKRPRFEARPVQNEMAQFVLRCAYNQSHGLVEAPTGVGKSLGALIPALAWAITEGKRVIIATYTNVLAEQYWQKDLPLAMELLGPAALDLKTELVMGKPRYACMEQAVNGEIAQMPSTVQKIVQQWMGQAKMGIESEFSAYARRKHLPAGIARETWSRLHVPPICKQRLCSFYNNCFYFRTRRSASRAQVVVTNHSVILADMELRWVTQGASSLLDEYDLLVLDEAHDFLDATRSALEFTLDSKEIANVVRMAARLVNQIAESVVGPSTPPSFADQLHGAANDFSRIAQSLVLEMEASLMDLRRSTLITALPPEILEQPSARDRAVPDLMPIVQHTAERLQSEIAVFYKEVRKTLEQYKGQLPEKGYDEAKELFNQQGWWFKKFSGGLQQLVLPETGATWIECGRKEMERGAKTVPLEFSELLTEHLWDVCPVVAMSATLTIDDSFEFFQTQTGLTSAETCLLPPVFNYQQNAALYLPPPGTLPEPPSSARAPQAEIYYQRLAEELTRILKATRGRALVLFASRAEMEAVRERMPDLPNIPILMQGSGGHSDLSDQFKQETHAVLFGLRSFWTGFDAPGETLSCVILARIPFEVPVEPAQVARGGLIESRGGDPFTAWTLPNAKQQIKQGSGRLLRRADDRGIICLLDARLHTKRYGPEIIQNMPSGILKFNDIKEAVKHTRL